MSSPNPAATPQYPRVWLFDINRRVYRKDPINPHRTVGGPIWREHWVEHKIVGETRVSWISNQYGTKIPKKGGPHIAFSEEEIDRHAFIHDHSYGIGQAVGGLKDYELLKRIAEMVGYTPEK